MPERAHAVALLLQVDNAHTKEKKLNKALDDVSVELRKIQQDLAAKCKELSDEVKEKAHLQKVLEKALAKTAQYKDQLAANEQVCPSLQSALTFSSSQRRQISQCQHYQVPIQD